MCYIEKQIAEYCDTQEDLCPECGFEMVEKNYTHDSWLQCTNKQCEHTIDLVEV